jgi:hypothetical protein
MFDNYWTDVTMSCDGDLLFMVASGKSLLQVDVDGKLVASFHRDLFPTQFRLKQTLVSYTFFQKLEGYVVNALPFVSMQLSSFLGKQNVCLDGVRLNKGSFVLYHSGS